MAGVGLGRRTVHSGSRGRPQLKYLSRCEFWISMINQVQPTVVNPPMSGLFSKSSISNFRKDSSPFELNGDDVFVSLLINIQDCGENWFHQGCIWRHGKPPPLDQCLPYSFRWSI